MSALRETDESDKARITWLFSTYGSKGVTVGANVQALKTHMPVQDFTGMDLGAALNDICKITGAEWYVDYTSDLHYFLTETNIAPFNLSDSPDNVNTFGYTNLLLPQESTGLKNAVYVIGNSPLASWYTDATSISLYGRREASLKDSNILTQDILDTVGASFLYENAYPKATGSLTLFRAGLQAGMTVQITNVEYGLSAATYRIQSVTTTWPSLSDQPIYTIDFGDPRQSLAAQIANIGTTLVDIAAKADDAINIVFDLSAGGANLVLNSSFELLTSAAWTIGSGWSIATSGNVFQGVELAKTQPSGSSTGELVTASFIPIAAITDDYFFSFWSNMSTYTAGNARAVLREYNAAGALQASNTFTISAIEGAWTRHFIHMGPNTANGRTAWNAATAKVKIAFYADTSPSFTWNVDGVQLERGNIVTAYAPTPQELVDGQVGTTQIADNAVTTAKVIANAITAGKIAANTITAAQIAAGTITATEIAAGAITTAKLNASAVISLVTNAGATVVIDSSGITIEDGALTFIDDQGETALDGSGFGPTWVRFLEAGLFNGDFHASTPTPASNINNSTNPLPNWSIVAGGGSHITAKWLADTASASGGVVRFTMTSSSVAGEQMLLEQIVPIPSARSQDFSLYLRAAFSCVSKTGSAGTDLNVDWLKADGSTTTGSGTLGGGLPIAGSVGSMDSVPLPAPPANAAYARIRVGVHCSVSTAAMVLDMTDVSVGLLPLQIGVAEAITPDTYAPGMIWQGDGVIYIAPNYNAANDAQLGWDGTNMTLNGSQTGRINIDAHVWAQDGIATLQNAGAVSDGVFSVATPLNGTMAHDTTNHRIYYKRGGVWHYAAETAGFQIPKQEVICPVCTKKLKPNDDIIGKGDRYLADGALHGLYIHLSCAGKPLNKEIADSYSAD